MGLLYSLVRPVARYTLRLCYRNIKIEGLENIPSTGAVVLAANHPTAFIEPCLLACFQPRSLHFLARGDLFKNALATATLRALNILPVFRLRDGGFEKLRDNYATFEACHKALSRQRAVMILAEGRCIHGKELLPLQKGTARVALGALDADATLPEVYVVPVGINFTRAETFRTDVMIRCGTPLLASDYLAEFRASPTPALHQFTVHLRQRLNPLIIQYPDRERAVVSEIMLEVARAESQHPDLDNELRVASLTDIDDRSVLELGAKVREAEVDMGAVAGAKRGLKSKALETNPALSSLKVTLLTIVALPVLAIWRIARWVADTNTNYIEFHSAVRFAAVAIGLFVLVPLALLLLPWMIKIWVVLALLSTRYYFTQREKHDRYRHQKTWERLVPEDRKRMLQLYDRVVDAVRGTTENAVT